MRDFLNKINRQLRGKCFDQLGLLTIQTLLTALKSNLQVQKIYKSTKQKNIFFLQYKMV